MIGRQILSFGSRVLDTFFYATLRKTLELTKLFLVSCKQNVTSSRFLKKKSYREAFDEKTDFVLRFTGSRYIFLRCATKNTRTDEGSDGIYFLYRIYRWDFRQSTWGVVDDVIVVLGFVGFVENILTDACVFCKQLVEFIERFYSTFGGNIAV